MFVKASNLKKEVKCQKIAYNLLNPKTNQQDYLEVKMKLFPIHMMNKLWRLP